MLDLLLHRDNRWLAEQRRRFLPANGSASSRISLFSGRTGTRLNIGQPQPRWAAGVDLALAVLGGRADSHSSSHALSIGSRIREAASIVAQFFAGSPAPT